MSERKGQFRVIHGDTHFMSLPVAHVTGHLAHICFPVSCFLNRLSPVCLQFRSTLWKTDDELWDNTVWDLNPKYMFYLCDL